MGLSDMSDDNGSGINVSPLIMWVVGILWTLVVLLGGVFIGDIKGSLSVQGLTTAIESHAELPAHPLSTQRQDAEDRRTERWFTEISRRLESMEEKIDRLADERRRGGD